MARAPLIDAIRIAPELEREARTGQTVAMPVDDGSAAAARAFAGEFSGVAQRLGQLADHAAQVEGQREGHMAGLDPEFRTRRDGTIRGEAFDRAALDTATAKARVDIHNDIEAASEKHKADPRSLAGVLAAKEKAWAESAPPELAPEVRNLFARGGTAALRQATRQLHSEQAEAQRATLQEEVTRSLRTIQQRAYGGGLDQAAVEASAADLATLQKSLGRRGPDGRPLVAPGVARKLISDARETVVTAQIEGAFDRLPDAESKQRFIEQFDKEFASSSGPAATFDFKTFEAVKRKLESQLVTSEAQARQQANVYKDIVSRVQARADKGEAIPPEELVALRGQVATRGTPEMQDALDDAVDSLGFQQALKVMPLAALEQSVADLRRQLADGSTAPSLLDRNRTSRRLAAAERLLNSAESTIKSNPLEWDNRVGTSNVQSLLEIDLKQPGALERGGAARIAQAELAAERHHLGRPTYLLAPERRFFAKRLEQGGAQALEAVVMIRRTFGDKAEAVLGEIGKDAPGGVILADLAIKTDITPAVMDAAEGLAMKTKAGHRHVAPSSQRAKEVADGMLGRSLGYAPNYMSQASRVADAIYESRAYRFGKTEAFDEGLWKQALSEALGEHRKADGRTYGGLYQPSSWTSHRIVLPPNVRQDRAGEIMASILPEDLGDSQPRGKDGKPIPRQMLRAATWVTHAPGKYLLAIGDPWSASPGWAVDGKGQTYVLDLEKALPAIYRRKPDLK